MKNEHQGLFNVSDPGEQFLFLSFEFPDEIFFFACLVQTQFLLLHSSIFRGLD